MNYYVFFASFLTFSAFPRDPDENPARFLDFAKLAEHAKIDYCSFGFGDNYVL